ncbi:hypothetical protein PLICRDRAFT_171262 [Plicaturopsis crispa FD-325 SS-3]|nr:hypothetical protein PLICRDRAFT_171262 [Plicaturopsis crispa FD-325 SS-3]
MIVTHTYHDVKTSLDPDGRPMRVFVISPNVPEYPQAKFPGVVVFSEIYQVTGPVERFAGAIASQGFVVAVPSIYHEFEGPEPLSYDVAGTDAGNKYKARQIAAYDEDRKLSVDLLLSLPNCNGRIGATGVCIGGHLAFRAAFDPRVLSSVCFFPTDIHSATLGKGKQDDSLARVRAGELTNNGEVVLIFGKQDTHVPREGRDLIRKTLDDAGVTSTFLEVQAQHAFVRDDASKGRWDAALTRTMFSLLLEVFGRTIVNDMGPKVQLSGEPEHVC